MSITIKDIIKLKKDIYSRLDDNDSNVKEQIEQVFDIFIENMDTSIINLPTPTYPLDRTNLPWVTPLSPMCSPHIDNKPLGTTTIMCKTEMPTGYTNIHDDSLTPYPNGCPSREFGSYEVKNG